MMNRPSRNRRRMSKQLKDVLRQAARLVRSAHAIVAVTHITPDPDAIGSLLGFGHAISLLGKSVVLLCDDGVPRGLRFLPGASLVVDSLPKAFVPDLVVALDASDQERVGKIGNELLSTSVPVINFDHHVTNLQFGTVNIVDPDWAATAEGLVSFLNVIRCPLTMDIAACLLAGIVGDTRSFSTSSTTSETLEIAAHLSAAGADIQVISEAIFNNRNVDVLKLWGLGLSNLILEDGIIWSAMSLADRTSQGVQDTNGSGLSNLLVSAQEAAIAAVFTEQPDGSIDLSMRAKPGSDVAQVALALGGGGHSPAAGAKLSGPLEQTVQNVIGLLKASLASNAPK